VAESISVLILEDSPDDAVLMARELRRSGYEPDWRRVATAEAFLAHLRPAPDLILADYRLPQFTGLDALRYLKSSGLDVPFIVVSGAISEDVAVECMREGAADYLLKDRLARLGPAVRRAREAHAIRTRQRLATEETVRQAVALREQDAFLQSVLNSVSAHVAVIDGQGVITAANRAWKRFALDNDSYRDDGYIGENYLDVCRAAIARGDESAGRALVGISAVLAGTEQGFALEYVCSSPTVERWFLMQVSPLVDGGGAVIAHIDITLHRQMENLLRRYQLLAGHSRDIMLFIAADGRIVEANRAAEQCYGYSRDELLSLHLHDLRAPETRAALESQMAQACKRGILFETRHMRHDGTQFPVEVSSAGIEIEGEAVFVSVVRDITERHEAAEALRASEERYRRLFENAPVGIMELDLLSTPARTVRANRQAAALFGWSVEDLLSNPITLLASPEVFDELHVFLEGVRQGEAGSVETMGRRRDATSFPVRVYATPLAPAARRRIIITLEDLTAEHARRSAEAAVEEERRRIAREIHDGLAQNLASQRLLIGLWHDMLDHNPAGLHAELDTLDRVLGESIQEARRAIFAA
jgi:PAS domain S-box-containing protein